MKTNPIKNRGRSGLFVLLLSLVALPSAQTAVATEKVCDHAIVLDADGRLLPWTTYDNVIRWSMNFIKHCPTTRTAFGDDPWYLVTSQLALAPKDNKVAFLANQNCQGNHAYWAVETLTRYYPYTGDKEAFKSTQLILDRVLHYQTPADWDWANVPRTQDNSPDGEYTDEVSEPDKMCAVGIACVKFYKLTGEEKYRTAAQAIAKTVACHVRAGDADSSPLPFRVHLKDGRVVAAYTSHMVVPVAFFDAMLGIDAAGSETFRNTRDALWKWVLTYPVKNHKWVGFYEDVRSEAVADNNQQSPVETARFMLQHPELDPNWKAHVPALLAWVKERFGKTTRYGATSIREQDVCFEEMGSHTARYASVVGKWFAVSHDPKDREEARASFALASYSAHSKYSQGDRSVNYTGIGYRNPWFTDSYFDYLPHLLEGMTELPEMAPGDADHILGSDSILTKVTYGPGRIEYTSFEPCGREILRITFEPQTILADGRELPSSNWTYGEYHGVPGVLRIIRSSARDVVIIAK